MVDFSILLIFLGLLKMLSQDSSVNEVGKEGCPYFTDKGTEAQRDHHVVALRPCSHQKNRKHNLILFVFPMCPYVSH